MGFKILHYKRNEGYEDCTSIVQNINLSGSIDSFGRQLAFDILQYNAQRYIGAMEVATGDIFVLYCDDVEEIRAVCTTIDEDNGVASVSCKDFAHYVNKSEICVKINKSRADEAIKDICRRIGVTVGNICDMSVVIDELCINSANSVIDSILTKQRSSDGKMRLKEFEGAKLNIIEYPSEVIDMTVKPVSNVAAFDGARYHSRLKKNNSMEDRYTAVRAYTKNNDAIGTVYNASNKDSIADKGMIVKNVEVSNADSSNIANIAKQELSILDRDDVTYSGTFLGNIKAMPGRVVRLVDDSYNIDDECRIESVTHTIDKGLHLMELTLSPLSNANYKRAYSEYKTDDSDTPTTNNTDDSGNSNNSSNSTDFEKLYTFAKQYLGVPYVWGGTSPSGFDCSGYVWYCYKNTIKPSLKRLTAQGYYNICDTVQTAKKGDLCFYSDGNKISHVGIYIGYGKMIVAEGTKVQIAKVSRSSFVGYGRLP